MVPARLLRGYNYFGARMACHEFEAGCRVEANPDSVHAEAVPPYADYLCDADMSREFVGAACACYKADDTNSEVVLCAQINVPLCENRKTIEQVMLMRKRMARAISGIQNIW